MIQPPPPLPQPSSRAPGQPLLSGALPHAPGPGQEEEPCMMSYFGLVCRLWPWKGGVEL